MRRHPGDAPARLRQARRRRPPSIPHHCSSPVRRIIGISSREASVSTISFSYQRPDPASEARLGRLVTPHGEIDTPSFVVVGTQAAVKSLQPHEVADLGAQAVLCNTYHLYLRPGPDLVAELGGLHRFMGWTGPIFTDSGGDQVVRLWFCL